MATIPTSAPGSFLLPHASKAHVSDAMHPGVISCRASTPLRDVARTLAMRHIHCIVVPTGGGWGVISGLDVVAAAIEGFEGRTAGDVAATQPVLVSANAPLLQAAELMVAHHVDHLVVLGAESGRPVGIVSTLDVAGVIAWGEG